MGSQQPRPEWTIVRLDEVASTMDVAAELARDGVPAGTVVVAEHQTSGRGQRGRVWLEPPGTCLLATILLRPSLAVATDPILSRRIAERISTAINLATGLRPAVKDPNDILICGRKVCGILCQTSIRGETVDYLLVGIGLNVNVRQVDLPYETATSLLVESGRLHDRDEILNAILEQLCDIAQLCESIPRGSGHQSERDARARRGPGR